MRRNKATPGAREEYHFLFEESVQEEERGALIVEGVGTYQNQSGMHHASVFSKERQSWRRGRQEEKERWDRSER